MKVLVIGSGGREHTLVYALSKSPEAKKIYCAPGNGGIGEIASLLPFSVTDLNSILEFAKNEKIDLTVVGPELPLALGIVDVFEREKLPIFGPNKRAAQLEANKGFAREFMKKYNIPTPKFFVTDDPEKAEEFAISLRDDNPHQSCVIKASGLAYGKGAFVLKKTDNNEDIKKVINDLMIKKTLGDAGKEVVVEDFIFGEEASLIAFTDSETILPCLPSQDHKRLYDNDEGPNTGGMGAYAPAPLIDEKMSEKAYQNIFLPLLKGLKEEGIIYKGIIYAGVIVADGNLYVLEFNCRFGDPEVQAILPLLKTDLKEVMMRTIEGNLKGINLSWEEGYALNVVLASKGYPFSYEKGKEIKIPERYEKALIFHSGTEKKDDKFYTAGGRVISVTGLGKTLKEAKENAYYVCERIHFEGKHFRRDIGDKGIKRLNEI